MSDNPKIAGSCARSGDMMPTRYSTGIALCARGADGIVRLLMVNRRFTYAFQAFVCGHYNERSDLAIITLFNGMTIDEKVNIMSMNFAQLWYWIWIGHGNTASYMSARSKFNEGLIGDGGARLHSLMRRSTTSAQRVWEIPKGHKKHPTECDMDCAIREFYEETGVPRSAYRITCGTYSLTFDDEGIRYSFKYFIAVATRTIVQRINAAALQQVSEICDMRWISAADMEVFIKRDAPGHRRIIAYVRKLLRNPITISGSARVT